MAANTRKRKDLTLADKYSIVKDLDNGITQVVLSKKHGVSQSVISRISKTKEQITDMYKTTANPSRKRQREATCEDVSEALLRWFKQARSKEVPVSGPMLHEKAISLGKELGLTDFNPSLSWVQRWRQRKGIVFKKQHGEKQDHDAVGADHWIMNVWPEYNVKYAPCDVYNCDETGLYFKALPEHSMCFKDQKPSGGKKAKERLTVLVTTNMDGSDKRTPLVIGKSLNPRCFRGVSNLPVSYKANKNAWMTSTIFEEWLIALDKEMVKKKRKICLLMDNCSAHNVKDLKLEAVEIVFLPPNTTSAVQPLDQGIIRNLKHFYRKRSLQKIISAIDNDDGATAGTVAKSINVLDAVNFIAAAWSNVTPETIQNCFFRGLTQDVGDELFIGFEPEDVPSSMDISTYKSYVDIDDGIPTSGDPTDAEICEDIKAEAATEDDITIADDDDTVSLPYETHSNSDILRALDIIRNRINATAIDPDHFYCLEKQLLEDMNSKVKQMTIDRFFQKLT